MRKLRWLAVLLVFAFFAASCGDDDDTTAEEPSEEPAEEPAAGECEGEEITIRQLTGAVGQELELAEEAAARYEETHPCVDIVTVETPNQVQDRLAVYLQLFEAQSSEGDIFQIDVIWPGDLAEHFIDLNEYGGAEAAAEHFPAIVENNTVDGKLVGIPWFTDAGLLYFRTDLLEKYGLEPPETWDELEAAAQTIQDGERADGNEDFWGFVWQGNAYEGLTCDALEWIKSAGGGSIIEPDGTITINNPDAIAMVERAAGWVGTISPPGVTAYDEEGARGVWQAGNAAFMRNWPYAYSIGADADGEDDIAGNADDSEIAGLFDVSPLPGVTAGNGAATLGGWQLAVSKYSDHPDVAADVALFLASYDEQKIRAIEGSLNPTIEALYSDEDVLAATPFFGSLYDVFTSAVARPSTITAPNYNDTSVAFFNAVHSVLTGESDAEDAFAELELDYQDLHPDFEVGSP